MLNNRRRSRKVLSRSCGDGASEIFDILEYMVQGRWPLKEKKTYQSLEFSGGQISAFVSSRNGPLELV